MSHGHNELPPTCGMVQAPRIDHHPDANPGDEPGNCGLCGGRIWVGLRTRHFVGMNPAVPILCCICAYMSLQHLRRAFPDQEVFAREVPDLARQGVFN